MSRQGNQSEIERYFLGSLSEEEKATLEEKYFSDDTAYEDMQIAEDELIDQYVRAELSNEDSERFAAMVAQSPRLAERVEFARLWKDKVDATLPSVAHSDDGSKTSGDNVRSFKSKPKVPAIGYLAIAASLIVFIGVGFGVWRAFIYEPPVDRGLVALKAAYRNQRTVEARLTGFNYAPLGNQRGGTSQIDYIQRDLATNLLRTEANERPSAASLHALGQSQLMEGKFDEAIDQFQKASALDPLNADLQADLGAAWLEKGVINHSTQHLERSKENLDKALQLKPALAEALFNRALCNEYLTRRDEAINDWRRFLQLDSSSSWATEAKEHLKVLTENTTGVSN